MCQIRLFFRQMHFANIDLEMKIAFSWLTAAKYSDLFSTRRWQQRQGVDIRYDYLRTKNPKCGPLKRVSAYFYKKNRRAQKCCETVSFIPCNQAKNMLDPCIFC